MKIVWSPAIIAGVVIMLYNYDAKLVAIIICPSITLPTINICYSKLNKKIKNSNIILGAYSCS